MSTSYNHHNFHKHTYCVFQQVGAEAIHELKLSYQSPSGSQYYFTEQGVYRASNHWGRAANCKWRLHADWSLVKHRIKIGFARWEWFYRDNEVEKLYYIYFDSAGKQVYYAHKDSPEFQSHFVLRTAAQTAQIIKSIRHLLATDAWAQHLNHSNIDDLRNQIIEQLMTTELSLAEIKRKFL